MTTHDQRMPRAALALMIGLLLPGCGTSGGTTTPADPVSTVRWAFTGLEPLGPGFAYEGWIIVGGMPVSTGRFGIDGAGAPTVASFVLPQAVAAAATDFVLSIEPDPDPDPAPAATKVLGGPFVAGQASLVVAHAAALGTDFLGASGSFVLATPSSAVMTDDSQGIWWLDPMGPAPTLQLSVLPPGWAYEGWIAGPGGPVTTGRFLTPAGADSDLSGPAGGPDGNGPPFPGQDFITPPMDLIGLTAVISVEPEPDDSPAPFALKPLLTQPIGAALAPTLQAMSNNAAASNPTGTATIE